MTSIDLTVLKPLTLRMLLASCAGAHDSPLDMRTKALVWWRLGQKDWLPTWEMSPVPQATVQQWFSGLSGAREAFMTGIIEGHEEDSVC